MSHTRLTRIIIAVVILIFIIFAFVGATYYILRESQKRAEEAARGYIVPQQEWPKPFVDLLEDAKQQDIKVDNINVYRRHDGGPDHYWVSEASPEFFALISKRWKLQPVEKNHRAVRLSQKYMPTMIEIPSHSNDMCYYLCSNWLSYGKDDLYCVMFDKANKVVIIRYLYCW